MPTSALARDRAKANLDLAEANRAHARAEKDRADALLKTGGITDKDHLSAQVAVQVAEASHAQARSELAIAERQLGRSQITAPISGRVAKRHADAGTIVNAGTPLYTIVDDSVFEFRSSVGSGDFGKTQSRRNRHRHGGCIARVRHRRQSESNLAAGRRS